MGLLFRLSFGKLKIDRGRFVTIGVSAMIRTLVVVHASPGEAARIISARPAARNEQRNYEEGL
jgi:hypothetical protein